MVWRNNMRHLDPMESVTTFNFAEIRGKVEEFKKETGLYKVSRTDEEGVKYHLPYYFVDFCYQLWTGGKLNRAEVLLFNKTVRLFDIYDGIFKMTGRKVKKL